MRKQQEPEQEIETRGRSGGHSTVLFLVAIRTLRSIRSKPRSEQSEPDAMICIVFAVAAIENFVYELGREALRAKGRKTDESALQGLGKLLLDLEDSRLPLFQKVYWLIRHLSGKPPDKGGRLLQDLDVLIRLRNLIIHLKDREETLWYRDGTSEDIGTPEVVHELTQRHLIPRPYRASWTVAISDSEVAGWACRTAMAIVQNMKDLLPDSSCKRVMNRSMPQEGFAGDLLK